MNARKPKMILRFVKCLPTWLPIDLLLVWTWGLVIHHRSLRLRKLERFPDIVFSIMILQRTELRSIVANKARVKEWITAVIGSEYTVPTAAEIVDPSQISNLMLNFPGRYVAKPSHASGRVYFLDCVEDQLDPAFHRFVRESLRLCYDREGREATYRMQAPSVLIEPDLAPNDAEGIDDFKIHCIHGAPVMIQHDTDRYSGHRQTYYTTDWRQLDIRRARKSPPTAPHAAPENLSRMLELAARLAEPFDYVRIDLYDVQDHILVGEITNSPWAARCDFIPVEFSRDLARLHQKTLPAGEFRQRWPGREID